MVDSMSEYLKQDMQCEGLLECIHGLKNLDREIFALGTDTVHASDEYVPIDALLDNAVVYRRNRSSASGSSENRRFS